MITWSFICVNIFFKKTTSKQEGTCGIPKKGKINWSVYILESRLINRDQFFVENELNSPLGVHDLTSMTAIES